MEMENQHSSPIMNYNTSVNGSVSLDFHNDSYYGQEMPIAIDAILVPVLWGLLIIIGICGNGLVVYVMMKYAEKNTTNCYIINLAFTDLAFVIIVVPFTMVHYVIPEWIFGETMCKLHMYMIYVTLQATCLTLTAITVDRYFSIVHPITSMRQRTPKAAVLVSVSIWIASLVICVPFAMYHGLKEFGNYENDVTRVMCREIWPNVAAGWIAIIYVVFICYLLPLLIICLCYARIVRHLWNQNISSRSQSNTQNGSCRNENRPRGSNRKRKRASKMIAVVVCLYAVLWLPIHIFQLWYKFDKNFPKNDITYFYKIFAHTLSYANSCVNPVVYAFLGDGFRKGVRKAFPWLKRFIAGEPSTAHAQSSFNMRNTQSDGEGNGNTFALSGIRKYFPLRLSTTASKTTQCHIEPSGVYIGVPTEEVFSRKTLEPRRECGATPSPKNEETQPSHPTYLESDI